MWHWYKILYSCQEKLKFNFNYNNTYQMSLLHKFLQFRTDRLHDRAINIREDQQAHLERKHQYTKYTNCGVIDGFHKEDWLGPVPLLYCDQMVKYVSLARLPKMKSFEIFLVENTMLLYIYLKRNTSTFQVLR